MSDLVIDIGYIGDEIIALCRDYDTDYAVHAAYSDKRQEYFLRIQDSDGLTTTGRFKKVKSARQMILIALAKHLEVREEHASMARKENHATPAQKLH